jgi:hypothetical protein
MYAIVLVIVFVSCKKYIMHLFREFYKLLLMLCDSYNICTLYHPNDHKLEFLPSRPLKASYKSRNNPLGNFLPLELISTGANNSSNLTG